MGQGKRNVSIPGVAEGKQLVGVDTNDSLSDTEKVRHFVEGAMSGDYEVRF
jgi:hypothetical protein